MTVDSNRDGSLDRKDRPRFKINVVSELTGISQDVLRVWERRYDAVTPQRTEGGTRLYSDSDIWRFTLLRKGVAKGHSIGRLVDLSNEELEKLERKRSRVPQTPGTHGAVVASFIDHISGMNFEAAQAELAAAVGRFSTAELIEQVFGPILVAVGDNWQHGEFGVAEEHLASNVLRSVMITIDAPERGDKPERSVVLATPEGERHEFGLMLTAISAALRHWRVVYLGLETPAEEIARTVRLTGSELVGLSIAAPRSELTASELLKLDMFLPRTTRVVAGGAGAGDYRDVIEEFGWSIATRVDEIGD